MDTTAPWNTVYGDIYIILLKYAYLVAGSPSPSHEMKFVDRSVFVAKLQDYEFRTTFFNITILRD